MFASPTEQITATTINTLTFRRERMWLPRFLFFVCFFLFAVTGASDVDVAVAAAATLSTHISV